MTEQFVRDLAERYGLTVLKRITTGTPLTHFATFELSGPEDRIRAAWPPVYDAADRGMARVLHVENPGHKDYAKPYIEIESVWCETNIIKEP